MKYITVAVFIFCALILAEGVRAIGVTYPLPTELELVPGETAWFRFEIQNIAGDFPIMCTYNFKESFPFSLTWNMDNPTIDVGKVQSIIGTVTAPANASFQTDNFYIIVSCEPKLTMTGSGSLIKKINEIPLKVSVVQYRTKCKASDHMFNTEIRKCTYKTDTPGNCGDIGTWNPEREWCEYAPEPYFQPGDGSGFPWAQIIIVLSVIIIIAVIYFIYRKTKKKV